MQAVEVFTKRAKDSVMRFKPEEVLSFLSSVPGDVSTVYLEYLIDVVKVKDGFARNFLLPRKKALRCT